MKFICSKQTLYDAIVNVSKAVSERSTLPSLEGIKFSLADSLLELTGYNLEMGIRTVISVRSEDKGSCIINARLFSEMIKKMSADEVLIDISESYQVTISGGVTKFNMFAASAEDYPELPEKDSLTEDKPILKGELFDIENNTLTMVAIDGYRMAVRYEPVKFSEPIKFVVPSKSLSEIQGLLSDNEEDTVFIHPSRKHIIFDIGGYVVYSRLLEGDFHPYKSAIPNSSNTDVVVDRKELISTLERAMLLINDRSPSPVRCYFENDHVKINCTTALGKISDEINAEISGPVIEIGFKCKYLLDPLKVIDDEKVKLKMGGSLLAMKIVPCEGEKYTYLVLPVRLPRE